MFYAPPTPEQMQAAIGGVDTAWNEYGAPPGWYPRGETQWSQTPEPDPGPSTYDTGEYGGTGGYAAPPPRPQLASSPEWLAYLNSLGLEQGQFTADIQRRRALAQSMAAQQAADITAQGPQERRQITGSLESRGMARSGQLVRSLAEQRAGEGRRQGQVQTALAGNLSDLETQLSEKLINLGAKRADQELNLRAQGYT